MASGHVRFLCSIVFMSSYSFWIDKIFFGSALNDRHCGVSLTYSYDLLLEQLGARIKQLRKARGWTLRDMVVQHGFHLSHWQAFESGNRGISLPSLLRIAEVLGITPSQLLKGLGEAKDQKTNSKK